jgi:hypothetical protein
VSNVVVEGVVWLQRRPVHAERPAVSENTRTRLVNDR